MLFKNSKTNKELKGILILNLKYVAMWPSVMYSNYFKIVYTVIFLDSRIGHISGIFLFKTVILYHIYL